MLRNLHLIFFCLDNCLDDNKPPLELAPSLRNDLKALNEVAYEDSDITL